MITPEQFDALEVDMRVHVRYRDMEGFEDFTGSQVFEIDGEIVAVNKRKRYVCVQTEDDTEYLIFDDELISVEVL